MKKSKSALRVFTIFAEIINAILTNKNSKAFGVGSKKYKKKLF